MTIDMKTLRHWLDSGRAVTILDVRPLRERAEWSIPGSLHVDAYDALRAHDLHALDSVQLPRETPVVTVCAAGKTSLLAADVLCSRGHQVYSLERGMKAWSLAWNTAEVPVPAGDVRVIQVRRTGKGCLSYIVGAGGEAAVIDASVQIDVYREAADRLGWKIACVIDTHVHADHLSRSRALAASTGAALFMPEQNRVAFTHMAVRDHGRVPIGTSGRFLTALRTPGHTAESTCFSLDGAVLFTGDTLFLGGVGRPDLEAGREKAEARAHTLFASLRRLLTFGRDTIILPGHSEAPIAFDRQPLFADLREVERRNPVLGESEERFVESVLARIPPTPPNFTRIVRSNESGVPPKGDPEELEAGANRCAVA
jgi:glyoxylase-like metal-dependent hydrolase (beta-lactamase superfamily II)